MLAQESSPLNFVLNPADILRPPFTNSLKRKPARPVYYFARGCSPFVNSPYAKGG